MMFKNVDRYVTEEQLFKAVEGVKLTPKQYETTKRAIELAPDLDKLI